VAIAMARIECHYFVNRGFFEVDGQLLRDVDAMRGIPGTIVHGRYDVVCPIESAWCLHLAWPEADFVITPDSGHSAFEAGNSRALVAATDRYASG
jgi:proline iminopeptidase